MKIHEIITERTGQQRVQLMYHGTSSIFLPSIKKHGLDPNPKPIRKPGDLHPSQIRKLGLELPPAQKSWYYSKDDAWQSYGGIYLTTDKGIAGAAARSAAHMHGGEPIIVTVQYVLGSGGLDEDKVNELIFQSFFRSSNINEFIKILSSKLLSKYKVNYPKGSYRDFIDLYNLMMSRYQQWIKDDPDPDGWGNRTDTDYWDAEHLAYTMMNTEEDHYVYMTYTPYRNLVNKIISKAKVTHAPHTYSRPDSEGNVYVDKYTNVRVTRPITFKDKTRIIDISKI